MIQTLPLSKPPAVVPSINDFLQQHTIEELATVPIETLQQWLAPYFPQTRKTVLPTEKPKKIGVSTRAVNEAIEANMDAINALLKSRGLKV